MTTVFSPIRPKKISEEIVEQIKELIAKGELAPGERIPSERELSALLGVSRPSVREAIMILEATGFLESRQGGGTFVRSLTEATMTDPLSSLMAAKDPRMIHALVKVRMGLESWSAYMAASHATDAQIAELEKLMADMEKQAKRGGWEADIDSRFHYIITKATHNAIQIHILDTIHTLFHATVEVMLFEFYREQGHVMDTLAEQHRSILKAIKNRDPEGARKAMLEHLTMVEQKVTQMMEREEK